MANTSHIAQTDVLIAGGGLAGSLAASMLARAGFRVVLVDPHSVYPPDLRCEKLDRAQVATLRRTGLAHLVLPSATHDGQAWVARFGRVVDKRPGDQYGILYQTLVNSVRATIPPGATFVQGLVTRVANGPGWQAIATSTGEEFSARLVILASGLNSGLMHSLGIQRQEVSKRHSLTFAFDLKPVGRNAFDFGSLTYYAEHTRHRVAYITLFPVGRAMRANLFAYRAMDDPWVGQMRESPLEAMHAVMPRLAKILGTAEVIGPVKFRPADLYVTQGYLKPGIVLVGDAFSTSCPAAGTGADKVLTDVERLCNVYVPSWMRSEGMGIEKLRAFYNDPVKVACDRRSFSEAFTHRSTTIDTGPHWRARRWARFLIRWAIGTARGVLAPTVPSQRPQTRTP